MLFCFFMSIHMRHTISFIFATFTIIFFHILYIAKIYPQIAASHIGGL